MIISLYVEHFVLHFMNVLCYINKVIIIIIIVKRLVLFSFLYIYCCFLIKQVYLLSDYLLKISRILDE